MQCEKLEQLAAYRDEYWQRYSSPKGAVFSVARLQDFRTFINRLDQAIEQQRQVVEHARNDSEEKKSQWLYERTREKAIGTVVEKFSVQEQKEFDRKEQKVADEFSQRAASRHSPH
jgi:flagellar FliJ protein